MPFKNDPALPVYCGSIAILDTYRGGCWSDVGSELVHWWEYWVGGDRQRLRPDAVAASGTDEFGVGHGREEARIRWSCGGTSKEDCSAVKNMSELKGQVLVTLVRRAT